jgi:ubiquinone/menaquinone biosynthesis C-methylase UbiE
MEDRLQMLQEQTVTLEDFPAEGWILDVGGGGEGVIGQLKGAQVVAVDLLEKELAEAPDGPLKVVMDARELRFLDDTFATATAFFSLIYLRTEADVSQVLAEVYRVLQPGGRFLVWGMEMPARPQDAEKDLIAVPVAVRLPQGEISTAYGCRWCEPPRTLDATRALAEAVGFAVDMQAVAGYIYTLVLEKPDSRRAGCP